jgi:hypothetical protein
MLPRLYLDTARLGIMSPGARSVQISFATLGSEETDTLYIEQLLTEGFHAWPRRLQRDYPGLSAWHGITRLKSMLRQLVRAGDDSRVLVAQRSAVLMKLAAQLLYARCRHVLTTDLSWPNYQRVLQREALRTGGGITQVPLRDAILHQGADCHEVIDLICRTFKANGCDGLFLPVVNNLGIKLPTTEIIKRLKQVAPVSFVVFDGAQAIGHVPLTLKESGCDLFLAGCHKWLGAYHPLGVLIHNPRPGTVNLLRREITQRLVTSRFDDPLLKLTEELESGRLSRFGETVNLLPLLTCQAAVADRMNYRQPLEESLSLQLANGEEVANIADRTGWTMLAPARCLRSGIVLLQGNSQGIRRVSPQALRRWFHDDRVALTAYRDGIVRISLTDCEWTEDARERFEQVLHQNAVSGSHMPP